MSYLINNRKTIKSWCLYDWANSVYNLTITTAIFPSYFESISKAKYIANKVPFLGFDLPSETLFSFLLSIAFGSIIVINIFLAGISDTFGIKKGFLKFFSTLGAISCGLLFFFDKNNYFTGCYMFILATIGYAGSLVYYNSYLPIIASTRIQDKVSALGFSYGYVGSVIMLILNLAIILGKDFFGIDEGFACKISFLMVGIWWLIFAEISFRKLPKDNRNKNKLNFEVISKGLLDIKYTFNALKMHKSILNYLLAFFFYSAGIQTIMFLATIFGKSELHLGQAQLIPIILIIQLIAVLGASILAKVSFYYGNITTLTLCCVGWIAICIGAYFTTTFYEFCMLAVGVGFMMGGVQSLSRSTFSKMLPTNFKNASSFSFYELIEKTSIVVGTFSFGIINMITGGLKQSLIALIVFFVISICIFIYLLITNKKLKQP